MLEREGREVHRENESTNDEVTNRLFNETCVCRSYDEMSEHAACTGSGSIEDHGEPEIQIYLCCSL